MKKIILFICLIVAAAAAGTIAFLMLASPATQTKFSKDEILFTTITDKDGEFVSNRTYALGDEPSYEVYEIKISNTKNVAFENAVVEHSGNVFVNSQTTGADIKISFQIVSGTSFSFTISSDNFETATMMYHAREYIQHESLKLKVATSPTGPFADFVEDEGTLYLVENQNKAAALADGFPSELWVIPYSTTHPGATFTTKVAASGNLELSGNQAPYRLTAKSEGASQLQIYTQDGSNVGKHAIFACKYVSPTGISGLPSKIDIDMSAETQYFLPNFTVLPVYAQNYEISFESTNQNVFTFENGKITAIATGSAELWVKIDDEVIKEIPVHISYTKQPELTFAINPATAEQFAGDITLSDNVLTLNLHVIQIWATVKINVGIVNFGGAVENISANVADPNNLLFAPAGVPSFEVGGISHLVYTINLSKVAGSLSIEFSKVIDNKTISQTLVISVVND